MSEYVAEEFLSRARGRQEGEELLLICRDTELARQHWAEWKALTAKLDPEALHDDLKMRSLLSWGVKTRFEPTEHVYPDD